MNRFGLMTMGCVLAAAIGGSASAATFTFYNGATTAQNAGLQAQFLSDIGEAPDHAQNFESGFSAGQNINGQSLGGGLSILDLDGSLLIETGPNIGQSNPIGSFALEDTICGTETSLCLTLNFSSAIDYLSFFYIDVAGANLEFITAGGIIQPPGLDTTDASGNSAEFFGFYSGGLAENRITAVRFFNVSGDPDWALDDLAWGAIVPVPVPGALPLLASGLGLLLVASRRRRA